MKLSKETEVEIRQLYQAYWDAYLRGDMETFASFLDDDIVIYGTAVGEIFTNKKDAIKFYSETAHEMTGKAEFRNREFSIHPVGDSIVIYEQSHLYILIENRWTFYGFARITGIFEKKGNVWKLVHQHGSFPDSRTEEGQQIASEKIKAENLQLREAVMRRTVELETKTRELEIESALERVRTVAMGMRKPDDMLSVCEVIAGQLQSLGVNGIRNVQTAIIDEGIKETYLNYQYFAQYQEGTIEHVDSARHPKVKDMIRQMQASPDAFFSHSFEGAALEEWKQYRKDDNQFPDPILEEAPAVHFYFYSIGEGGLGLSTYTPLTEEKIGIFHKFRNVFALAYQRFRDIEQAEDQAREAQIELALERVRARTMAMQHSDELSDVVKLLYQEFDKLKISNESTDIEIGLINEETGIAKVYGHLYLSDGTISTFNFPFAHFDELNHEFRQWKNTPIDKRNELFITTEFSGDLWNKFIVLANEIPELAEMFRTLIEADITKWVTHNAYFSYGLLTLQGTEAYPPETLEIQKRFAKVFEQTYIRFLDLQKAEAQAREAQIELALERVRARTMAMQHSEELHDTSLILFEQLKELGEPAEQCTIGIIKESEGVVEISATLHGTKMQQTFRHKLDEPFVMKKMFKSWKDQQKTLLLELKGEELQKYNQYRNELVGKETFPVNLLPGDRRIIHIAYFSKGILALSTNEPRPAESLQLLERFAIVFEQTYTRFLDLQKAEAQAREAQIEAALERVRSRTMAMQKSDELRQVIHVVYDQFLFIEIPIEHTGFILDYKERDDMQIWLADYFGSPFQITIPYFDSPHWNSFREAKAKGESFFTNHLGHQEKNKFYRDLFAIIPSLPEDSKQALFDKPGLDISTVLLENVGLYMENYSGTPFTDEENNILMRFGKVFQQTYTRFLDLQKAETQAREAQIETSLERVRSVALGMRKAVDLLDICEVLYAELEKLEFSGLRNTMINILDDQTETFLNYDYSPLVGRSITPVRYDAQAFIENQVKKLKASNEAFVEDIIQGARLKELIALRISQGEADDPRLHAVDVLTYYFYSIGVGAIGISSFHSLSEEQRVLLRRFRNVFEFAYRRYMDIAQAEAQAREAQIETGLERVRSRTMAMQSCDELAETAAVVLHELEKLGIAPNRLYIAIIENDNTDVHFYLTDEEGGKDCSVYTARIDDNISVRRMYEGWATQQSSITLYMEGDELTQYFKYLKDEVGVPFKNSNFPTRRVQNIAYFSQGYIGIASQEDQPDETLKLLERFAAVFNLTYTRFNDLKQAEKLAHQATLDLFRLKEEKARTELALTELKAAQAQLIQSEKMASLGELTAGIAHEIQNPLNFVNNFSDVNTELIEEMKEELQSGNQAGAMAIANDIADNEQKINHHGKRADAIVKGMLLHSRTSGGVKEPTDINALADEYLRLAYHGLRAKDKSFNASMKTDFDKSLGKVDVIPQDIGRVILNLITNAFYAVSEKQKSLQTPYPLEGGPDYLPTVSVTTKHQLPLSGGRGSDGATVTISVSDNGPGIPAHLLDKIFQPFFTTKPTGQGTGLGLSLSYDIVKAHGGELKVETKQGEGSVFIIQLPVS